jgi:D-alanyl-D-alanine carboxypeptidase
MHRIRAHVLAGVVALTGLLAVTPGQAGAARFSTVTERALASIVVSGMGAGAMPGVAVGVWVPGQGSFVRAFGTSSLATGRALRLDDHFRIASISKSFTATAILRLADQHRLSLCDPLSKYIPGIQNGDRITVAQLLDMTSGVYDYVNDPAVLRAYARNPLRPFSLRDVVAIIKRHKPLFAPGTDTVYDNSNYYLLGKIAEEATHTPLGAVIQSQILRPLG